MTDEELKAIAVSNARSIQALTDSVREFREGVEKSRQEYLQDRAQLYSLMTDLTQNQSRIYRVLENMDRRQGEIVEVLKLVAQRQNEKNQ
ncbi:MAG: hypothetical protein GDA44_07965 [Prochloron sp. SP5CPC1]|nr:hypothetical protein [Candidatus Paraprochloron terpiosi SP5CPC1]